MKAVTFMIFSLVSYVNTESVKRKEGRIEIAKSLFKVFDDNYHKANSNQDQCATLQDKAAIFSLVAADTVMPEMELDENFICFCSTSPYHNFLKPTAEWIFSSVFVQYSVIQAIFSLTVCRIYNLYALENPNVDQAEDCASVASYLNVFRSIAIEDRISEIGKIYKLAGNEKATFEEQKRSFNMLEMQAKLLGLDNLLNRLTHVTETEGLQQVPPLTCRGDLVDKDDKHDFPLAMHLDFYINANMNVKKAPSRAFESIESRYMKIKSNNARDENYHKYYYKEAWSDLFHIFFLDFFPMVNYFNKVLYGDEVIIFHSGAFEPFIPPIDESLKVWAEAHELMRIIETKPSELNRSKVITILETIQMAKTGMDERPKRIKLTYKSERDIREPDFSVNLK